MKRIMNHVAVQTLLYTVRPQESVIILDLPDWLYGGTVTFKTVTKDSANAAELTVDEILHDYRNERIAKAAIHVTAVNNEGKLVLVIDTKAEEY